MYNAFLRAFDRHFTNLQDSKKRPDSILRQMPVWSWEEIQAARQHIFSSQNEADVADRYSRWGGIPRMVLQNLDAFDQGLLTTALNSCSLSELTSSMADLSSSTSKLSDMLLHQTVDAGYLKGHVVFASEWVEKEAMSRHSQGGQLGLRDFLAGSGGVPSVAAFRVALWEHYAHAALQRGGCFSCMDLQNPEAGPFEIELEPCSSPERLPGTQDISTGRSSGVYGWERARTWQQSMQSSQPGCSRLPCLATTASVRGAWPMLCVQCKAEGGKWSSSLWSREMCLAGTQRRLWSTSG